MAGQDVPAVGPEGEAALESMLEVAAALSAKTGRRDGGKAYEVVFDSHLGPLAAAQRELVELARVWARRFNMTVNYDDQQSEHCLL